MDKVQFRVSVSPDVFEKFLEMTKQSYRNRSQMISVLIVEHYERNYQQKGEELVN